MNAQVRLLCCVLLVLVLGGCSSKFSGPPLRIWQSQVEEYIEIEAGGDPSALRNTRDKPSEMAFGVISAKSKGLVIGESRTDVNGVVLGHRRIDGDWWFIFLVGVVNYEGTFSSFPLDNADLETVELLAMNGSGGTYRWVVAGPNAEALAMYRQGQLEVWRKSHPDRTGATGCETEFPTERDQFVLDVNGNQVTVVDDHTGATWTLAVAN